MFKIEGDHRHVQVNTTQDYNNGSPAIKATVSLDYDTSNLIDNLRVLQGYGPQLMEMVNEWSKYKRAIEQSPAVKASWESFLTMVSLAKEMEEGNNGGSA